VNDPIVCTHQNGYRAVVNKRHHPGTWGFSIFAYVVVTFAWSWGLWTFIALTPSLIPHSRPWSLVYVGALCGPLVGAVIANLHLSGGSGAGSILANFRRTTCGLHEYLFAILFPPAAWIVSSLIQHGQFSFDRPLWVLLTIWAKMLVRGGPLTEEVGWRGFLLPQLLQRMNLFWATMILIPVWAVWHLPLWWLPGLPHHNWSFALFLLLLAPTTVIFSWLYVSSGHRVWLPILCHTSINFALFFTWVVPNQKGGNAFYLLLGFFWVAAVALLCLKRELWFARVADRRLSRQAQCREELLTKGYVT